MQRRYEGEKRAEFRAEPKHDRAQIRELLWRPYVYLCVSKECNKKVCVCVIIEEKKNRMSVNIAASRFTDRSSSSSSSSERKRD